MSNMTVEEVLKVLYCGSRPSADILKRADAQIKAWAADSARLDYLEKHPGAFDICCSIPDRDSIDAERFRVKR